MGIPETVKGAITPEKPLSLAHWIDSLNTVLLVASAIELACAAGAGSTGGAGSAAKPAAPVKPISITNLDDFIANPKKLSGISPEDLHLSLRNSGYDVQPLGKGSLKGIPFEDGGGFKVNWGGDKILQYHPNTNSHHGSAYYKISSGTTGTVRIDLDGNIIN